MPMHSRTISRLSPISQKAEMPTNRKYTTALAKGQGIIEETLALLSIWEPGMTPKQLADRAVKEGVLGRATAKRVRDLVFEAFAPRYLVDSSRPARYLKMLLKAGATPTILNQLFLIYTARANFILHDFIREIYWPKYSAGIDSLDKKDTLNFLETAYTLGKLSNRWSEKMILRVASYLGGCLADFGLLENGKKGIRKILPVYIQPFTSLCLIHELHFSGYADNGILQHPDWELFGLEKMEVLRELQRVSKDYFIPQFSGDLLRISWKYKSMKEAIHAIARSEL